MHRFYQEQEQIDGGKMDKFVAVSGAGALPMGYYRRQRRCCSTVWPREYTLADRFFHAAFGGGFLNHFWLICACTPRYDNAPARSASRSSMQTDRMIKGRSRDARRLCRQHDRSDIDAARSQDPDDRLLLPLADDAHDRPSSDRRGRIVGVVFRWLRRRGRRSSGLRGSSTIISRLPILQTTPMARRDAPSIC